MDSLAPVLVCILIVITFGVILICLSYFIFGVKVKQPPSRTKSLPYECGLEAEETITSRVPVQYYLTAILFILFDIEIIFLYPWALSFNEFLARGKGLEVLLAMIVFLLIFVYGLFWEIFSKALNWK